MTMTMNKALAFVVIFAALAAIEAPTASAAERPDTVAALIAELGLEEAPTPVRERQEWRVPRKIVVLAPGGMLSGEQQNALGSAAAQSELVIVKDVASAAAAATDADVLVGLTGSPGICEPEIIEKAGQLRWILSLSAGVERCVAIPAVRERNLLITNMRGVESATIAEHTIALMLALARGIDTFVMNGNEARWSFQDAMATGLQSLRGKTLLVVGLGGIGTEVASRAHALGMKVVATRASGRSGPEFVSYVGLPQEMPALARSADVIVNAAPLTSATTGLFDARFFATLKPSCLFINVARGKSVVTADLVNALNEGRIAGAGLDVVEPEPLPPDHPLWRARNVIITPHISSLSDLPGEQRWILVRENLRRYVAGEKMLSVVDLNRGY